MMGGKGKCMILKRIRKAVADVNGICYEPHECTFQGECSGTCPACEAEVRYLERELNLRRLAGRAVTVAGIALGAAALSACGNDVMTHLGQEQTAVKADDADKVFGMVEQVPRLTTMICRQRRTRRKRRSLPLKTGMRTAT